jgi:hypothetical protein
VIKENVDGLNGEDNRIIDLQTDTEQMLIDPNGASGHSDMGFGYMIAEDNFNRLPGAVRALEPGERHDGGQPAAVAGQGELVYQLASWSAAWAHRLRRRAAGTADRPADGVRQQREPRRRCRASTRSSASGSMDRSTRSSWRRTSPT